jgi:hypothetical protein
MRAGEQAAIAEPPSLLPLGLTRDVTRLAALYVVCRLHGAEVHSTVADGPLLSTRASDQFTVGAVGDRDRCTHSG